MGIRDTVIHKIDQGEDAAIECYLVDEETGEPLDLTDVEEITARFKNTDGTLLELAFTDSDVEVLSIAGAKVKVTIEADESLALNAGQRQDFEIEATLDGTIKKIVKFPRQLDVTPTM
jgi:hypothetical protein